ncbi:hypothetical protein [Nioella ostreopsis]|uniref:hypothetical protein n=1 Tax=Nioella ostreopsis TaxID=2448479 RepID=UPI000FD91757|nr:hypothetical protein [Nioella ostreopsis]
MENTLDNHQSFRLPKERVIKLDELREALGGATMSATIGTLLASAREQGLIGHGLPGVEINRLSDGVAIRFDGGPTHGMSFQAAMALASSIKDILSGAEIGALVNLDHNFTAKRRGSGFRVILHGDAEESVKTWSPDIALEFAELLERSVESSE